MKQLLVVTLIVFLVLGVAYVFARQFGAMKTIAPKDHRLLKENFTIVAHRGGSQEAPENTLLAFEYAAKLDPRIWLELDVRMTKDGSLVVIHDENIDRTTNGTGLVSEFSLSELQKFDAAFKFEGPNKDFPHRGKGVQIPLLKDVLTRFSDHNIVVEVKDRKSYETARRTLLLIEELKAEDRIVFACSNENILKDVKKFKPEWIYNTSETEVRRQLMLATLHLEQLATFSGDFLMIPPKDGPIAVYNPQISAEAKRRFKKIFLWTINDEHQMQEFIQAGIDGLITDRPKALLEIAKGISKL